MNAADIIRTKDLLPTAMGSDELREQIAADILRRCVFSARMESARYLALVRETCAQFAAGEINRAKAIENLMLELGRMGYSPIGERGKVKGERLPSGGPTDHPSPFTLHPSPSPASLARLKLVVTTQRQMAASVARLSCQTASVLHRTPAWELARVSERVRKRSDWHRRWAAAGSACGFEGALQDRFIALKDSPIWAALGDGEGGFRDTLMNPFPPFAFNSGMGWIGVGRDECIRLGLIGEDDEVGRPDGGTLSPVEKEIAEAAERFGLTEEALMKGLA